MTMRDINDPDFGVGGMGLRTLLNLQKKLLPDLIQLLSRRYRILHLIRAQQPVGRRTLAHTLSMSERVVRSETEFLKSNGLLLFSVAGMSLSDEGQQLVEELDGYVHELFGLQELEQMLQERLHIRQVVIVPGDSSQSPWIQKDLGKAAVEQLKQVVQDHWVVAVTGGTTMATVAEEMTPSSKLKTLLFVPARGGLGEKVEIQANTICSKMAQRSGGDYRLLHVPDELTKEAYESLVDSPQIAEISRLISLSKLIIHGIGDAHTMATRRKSNESTMSSLREQNAVSEAFGYYFNDQGQIVHRVQHIGFQLEKAHQIEHIIAVAGGRSKARAILSFIKYGFHDILVTDEGAARELLEILAKED